MKILLTGANGYTGMRLLPKLLELGYTVVCVVRDVKHISIADPEAVLRNIWKIGGDNGWYYGNWVWKMRGLTDKFNGGVGLRRGRTHPARISTGDALDFRRVLLADQENGRLLLFAEMRLPREDWLEFRVDDENMLNQTDTFRHRCLWGRIYWYSMLPFHYFSFEGMLRNIAKTSPDDCLSYHL